MQPALPVLSIRDATLTVFPHLANQIKQIELKKFRFVELKSYIS